MVKIEKLKDEFCSKIYDFSAENFIEELITNGNKINCDETSTSFNKNMGIPWFYNEKLFKRSWKSLLEVRNKHKIASKRSCAAGLKGITQYQMALTQFGFMGMALTKKENVGIHEATEEEWKSFIHVWRVFGHVMGIEDR
ncbi:unnamed protein product [Brassicogethes aeneus]|uniref:ER-bound oxygenase mpaB/mpaB'/Rubber oxygenase catalytic domain-containing protein n=1 Tax=Brassicogethes aeneus TaxID=1431903 RepID=A0A9P0BCS4_BRAAE|nr:unnamed protein product [Brassicogethes aeneus]